MVESSTEFDENQKKKKKIILKFNYIPEIHTYGISSKNTQLPNKKKGLPILHKFERKKT